MSTRFVMSLIVAMLVPIALPVQAGADMLIAVDSNRNLYDINMSTGAKTQIGTVSANAGTTAGLAFARPLNKVYLTSTSLDSLFTLDVATGTATLVGAYGDSSLVMHGLEYDDSTGILYGASNSSAGNGGLYIINQSTGAATLVGFNGLTSFHNLGYNSDTDNMYLTNSNTDSFYSVNRATGATTLIGALGGPTNPNGLAYNWNNQLLYLVDNSTDNLYTINQSTGAATLIGSTGTGNLLGLMYYSPIPEPASALAGGIAATLFLFRRRRVGI